jgi:hypothetical protein
MKTKPAPKTRRTAGGQIEVWAPQPPRIGMSTVQRLLLRHVAQVSPETKLWVAMIAQAMGDAISSDDNHRLRARRFLIYGKRLAFWCELIGLDLGFVREVAIKAGYLVHEDALWKPMKPAKTHKHKHCAPHDRNMTEATNAGL